MKRGFLILFFLPPLFSFSQAPSFRKLSCPEKWWVVFHPFVAKKAYRITLEARLVSKETEKDSALDGDADGGQVDAFRHAYWMARLAQEICPRKAMSLGKAHERGNYRDFLKHKTGEEIFSDSIAGVMDLENNITGIDIGKKNRSISGDELRRLIIEKIRSGELKIILKDKNGNSLDCKHQILDLKKFAGMWGVPRCLVGSSVKRE